MTIKGKLTSHQQWALDGIIRADNHSAYGVRAEYIGCDGAVRKLQEKGYVWVLWVSTGPRGGRKYRIFLRDDYEFQLREQGGLGRVLRVQHDENPQRAWAAAEALPQSGSWRYEVRKIGSWVEVRG